MSRRFWIIILSACSYLETADGIHASICDAEVVMLKYKVVELSTVTDESIEDQLNQKSSEGWKFDGIHFAMRESQKRPSMAYLIFTREE